MFSVLQIKLISTEDSREQSKTCGNKYSELRHVERDKSSYCHLKSPVNEKFKEKDEMIMKRLTHLEKTFDQLKHKKGCEIEDFRMEIQTFQQNFEKEILRSVTEILKKQFELEEFVAKMYFEASERQFSIDSLIRDSRNLKTENEFLTYKLHDNSEKYLQALKSEEKQNLENREDYKKALERIDFSLREQIESFEKEITEIQKTVITFSEVAKYSLKEEKANRQSDMQSFKDQVKIFLSEIPSGNSGQNVKAERRQRLNHLENQTAPTAQ